MVGRVASAVQPGYASAMGEGMPITAESSTCYRAMLSAELEARQARNRAYSMRAFAKDLRLSNAYLSQILKGRRALAEHRAAALIERLRWPDAGKQVFLASVRLQSLKDERLREQCLAELRRLGARLAQFANVPLTTFALINTWYHSAVLEMSALDGFRPDAAWIARRLGISARNARAALADLVQSGLLKPVRGRWRKIEPNTRVPGTPSHILRAYHLQLLDRARWAIEGHPIESRKYGGVTMAIDPDRLEEANRRITEFRQELMAFLEQGNRRAIYHFSTILFRLDQDVR